MNRFLFVQTKKKALADWARINCQNRDLAQAGRGQLACLAGALVKIMDIDQKALKTKLK